MLVIILKAVIWYLIIGSVIMGALFMYPSLYKQAKDRETPLWCFTLAGMLIWLPGILISCVQVYRKRTGKK